MRISQLAARTGVAVRLLRYYEQQGLVRPERDARGWRSYSDGDEARVREIRSLIEAGLPTAAIRQLLAGPVSRPPAREVNQALLDELTVVHDRLDARIRCLQRNRDALASWLNRARRCPNPSGD